MRNRKHMKRHERPYGCTFLSCGKTFGSKNDWKRHENSQHFQIETWRCDGSLPEGGPCSKVYYKRQSFLEHLVKQHLVPPSGSPPRAPSTSPNSVGSGSAVAEDEEQYKDKLESCRIGRNSQDRFWCGFCVQLVDLRKKGLDAWTERFDHIDDHFMGRRTKKVGIRDWVPVDGSSTSTSQGGKMGESSSSSSDGDGGVEVASMKSPKKRGATAGGREGVVKRVRTTADLDNIQVICVGFSFFISLPFLYKIGSN